MRVRQEREPGKNNQTDELGTERRERKSEGAKEEGGGEGTKRIK